MSPITVHFSVEPDVSQLCQWSQEDLLSVLQTALSLIPHCPLRAMEVTVAVVTDDTMKDCYKRFKGIEKITNVLAFPTASEGESWYYDPHGTIILGDIVLSLLQVQREADAIRIPLHQHMTHLVVHGFLHLFHYDHETDVDARIMEDLESQIMVKAGWADPYEVHDA